MKRLLLAVLLATAPLTAFALTINCPSKIQVETTEQLVNIPSGWAVWGSTTAQVSWENFKESLIDSGKMVCRYNPSPLGVSYGIERPFPAGMTCVMSSQGVFTCNYAAVPATKNPATTN